MTNGRIFSPFQSPKRGTTYIHLVSKRFDITLYCLFRARFSYLADYNWANNCFELHG